MHELDVADPDVIAALGGGGEVLLLDGGGELNGGRNLEDQRATIEKPLYGLRCNLLSRKGKSTLIRGERK